MATLAISNCLFSPTSENPRGFSVWCVLAKLSAKPRYYSYTRPLYNIRQSDDFFGYLHQNRNPMATVDKIRNELIDKILAIQNKDFLEALDKLVSSTVSKDQPVNLSKEQKLMLEMSEEDIKNGRLVSQEEMVKRNLEWLNEK